MMTVTKEFTFDAAHCLGNGYIGKCSNMHGHLYKLHITVALKENARLSDYGFVIDFSDLKSIWKENLEPQLDHQFLNDSLQMQTTAENMIIWLFNQFSRLVNNDRIEVVEARLWETPTSFATYNKQLDRVSVATTTENTSINNTDPVAISPTPTPNPVTEPISVSPVPTPDMTAPGEMPQTTVDTTIPVPGEMPQTETIAPAV